MVAPAVTLTAVVENGLVVTRWTGAVNQRDFKVSVTRMPHTCGGRKTPTYGTEHFKGQFLRQPQAHLIQGSDLDELTWDGEAETSGKVCNGHWRFCMYYIDDTGDRSPTASAELRVNTIPCPSDTEDETPTEDDQITGELPAPPNFAIGQASPGTNVVATWDEPPSPHHQAEFKLAIYDLATTTVDENNVPQCQDCAIAGTIRTEAHRNDPNRAHYAIGGTRRVTFSDTSPTTNQQLCNGNYLARLRYKDANGRRSEAAVARFSVTGIPCPAPEPTPLEPDAPAIPEGQGGVLAITSPSLIDTDKNYLLEWNAVFASGLPQGSVKIERDAEERSGQTSSLVTHYWNGTTTGDTFTATDTQVSQRNQNALLRGGAPTTATWDNDKFKYLGRMPEWVNNLANAQLRVTAYDTAGNATNTASLDAGMYGRLEQRNASLAINTTGSFPVATARYTRRQTDNFPVDIKIAVYEWDGTNEGEIVAGTTRERGMDISNGAHWLPLAALGYDMFDPNPPTTFILNLTVGEYFSNAPPFGRVRAALRYRDRFGRSTTWRRTSSFNWSPPLPRSKTILPIRVSGYTSAGVPILSPPLTGYSEGEAIAIAYYNTPGGSGAANEAIIQRREFSRRDGVTPNQDAVDVLRFTTDRIPDLAWPTDIGVAQPAGAIDWFVDESAKPNVEYQYRVRVLDTRTGGVFIGNWTPA